MVVKDKITESEFKEIFGLHEKCKITKTTLNQYTKYLIGSYLFHHELYNLGENPKNIFKTKLSKHKVILKPRVSDRLDYQNFVMDLGSKMDISLSYKLNDNESHVREFIPFWSQTHFDKENKQEIVSHALRQFADKVFSKLQSKFIVKYGVSMKFRFIDNTRRNTTIWLDGFKFVMDLPYVDENGHFTVISGYEIKQSITNKYNIFSGNLLNPVKRILDQVELTKYNN